MFSSIALSFLLSTSDAEAASLFDDKTAAEVNLAVHDAFERTMKLPGAEKVRQRALDRTSASAYRISSNRAVFVYHNIELSTDPWVMDAVFGDDELRAEVSGILVQNGWLTPKDDIYAEKEILDAALEEGYGLFGETLYGAVIYDEVYGEKLDLFELHNNLGIIDDILGHTNILRNGAGLLLLAACENVVTETNFQQADVAAEANNTGSTYGPTWEPSNPSGEGMAWQSDGEDTRSFMDKFYDWFTEAVTSDEEESSSTSTTSEEDPESEDDAKAECVPDLWLLSADEPFVPAVDEYEANLLRLLTDMVYYDLTLAPE